MIDILLATYNGGRFLKEQLDSLLHQTQGDVRILVQDDGSKDDTPVLLSQYVRAYPGKIISVSGPAHEKSAKGNFLSLAQASGADYALFCDQDDVWDREKVSLTLARMLEGEAQYGKETPLLVHCDLKVVDADLKPIAPSFWRYQKLDAQPSLSRLLCQNSITGCAMMVNRPLRELMCKAPSQSILMHDWWAALLAASLGRILTVDRPLLSYRQHGGNQLGATGFKPVRDVKKAVNNQSGVRARLNDTFSQAEAFYALYQSVLPEGAAKAIRRYAAIPAMNKAQRMYTLLRRGYLKKGLVRCLGQMYYV